MGYAIWQIIGVLCQQKIECLPPIMEMSWDII